MIVVAFVPALVAGALLSELREARALHAAPSVIAVSVHRRRHRHADRRALPARARPCSTRTTRRCRARSASASCQMLALIPGVSRSGATIVGAHADRASIGRRRRSSRSFWRCRRWRRRSRTICSRCGTISASARGARDRRRLRDGVRRLAAGRQAVPRVRPARRASRRSPGTGSSLGVVAARGARALGWM